MMEETKVGELVEAMDKARPTVTNILRYYPDDVDDVIQNAAVNALRKYHTFCGRSAFSTWFHRIAVNQAFMYLRKKKFDNRKDSIDELEFDLEGKISGAVNLYDQGPDPERWTQEQEEGKILHRELALLSPRLRLALLLHVVEGYTAKEIAQNMNMGLSAVKGSIFRARHQLRDELVAAAVKRN